jgi:RNA polymerase sigma-70 factor (ECF subfamily)
MNIEQILVEFKQELFGFVLKQIKDEDTAKDIHQEILIKIFTKYQSLKNEESLKSWIYQIARNTITDYFRRNNITDTEISENYFSFDTDLTREDELMPCINLFIQQLRPNYKQALEFTYLENNSQKELADKLNISHSGAKSTVQRARQQLKKMFEQCCKIETDRYGSILSVTPKTNCSC